MQLASGSTWPAPSRMTNPARGTSCSPSPADRRDPGLPVRVTCRN